MTEIDKIRQEIRQELLKDILEHVIKSLTPKEGKVLDRLELSNAEIAKDLHCKPPTISQVLHVIYGKFGDSGIINFEGRNKRGTMISAWREIREQYEVKPVSEQER